ncbi:MAG: DUF3037 domain-containing protein [Thermoguttaceae bacterium]|jgi:hypothetical protein
MTAKRGYYSLVQFYPNPSRAEAVNLGVVLFCPDAGFLGAKMSAGNKPAMKLVGRAGIDPAELNAAKRAIEHRLHADLASFRTLDDFRRYAETRANVLRLTAPRPIKAVEPEQELAQLFQELVGGRSRSPQDKVVLPSLDELFHRLEQEKRARLNVTVTVPIEGRPLHVPYEYRNGDLNLVRPQLFSSQEGPAIRMAVHLAVAGDLLQRYGADEEGAKRLIILSSFRPSENGQELKGRVADVLHEYKVKNIPEEDVPTFVARVEQEAR